MQRNFRCHALLGYSPYTEKVNSFTHLLPSDNERWRNQKPIDGANNEKKQKKIRKKKKQIWIEIGAPIKTEGKKTLVKRTVWSQSHQARTTTNLPSTSFVLKTVAKWTDLNRYHFSISNRSTNSKYVAATNFSGPFTKYFERDNK